MPLPWLIGAAAVVVGGAVVAALSDDDSSSSSSTSRYSSDDRDYEYELEQQRRAEKLENIQANLAYELENFDTKFSYIEGLQFSPKHHERDFSSDVPDNIEDFGRNLSQQGNDFEFYKAVFERKPTWTAEFKQKKSDLESLKKEYQLLVSTTDKLTQGI